MRLLSFISILIVEIGVRANISFMGSWSVNGHGVQDFIQQLQRPVKVNLDKKTKMECVRFSGTTFKYGQKFEEK